LVSKGGPTGGSIIEELTKMQTVSITRTIGEGDGKESFHKGRPYRGKKSRIVILGLGKANQAVFTGRNEVQRKRSKG